MCCIIYWLESKMLRLSSLLNEFVSDIPKVCWFRSFSRFWFKMNYSAILWAAEEASIVFFSNSRSCLDCFLLNYWRFFLRAVLLILKFSIELEVELSSTILSRSNFFLDSFLFWIKELFPSLRAWLSSFSWVSSNMNFTLFLWVFLPTLPPNGLNSLSVLDPVLIFFLGVAGSSGFLAAWNFFLKS